MAEDWEGIRQVQIINREIQAYRGISPPCIQRPQLSSSLRKLRYPEDVVSVDEGHSR